MRFGPVVVFFLAACGRCASESPIAESPIVSPDAEAIGRGEALFHRLECVRCHTVDGVDPGPLARNCIGCHREVEAGRSPGSAEDQRLWAENLDQLVEAPDLTRVGARLRSEWIEDYLIVPQDLRPHLRASMPRLAMTAAEAHDLAAWLTRDRDEIADVAIPRSDVRRGEELFRIHRCGRCHDFVDDSAGESRLAPDLRFARERVRPEHLVAWLRNPQALAPHTTMPNFALSESDAQALAAYVLFEPLAPPEANEPVEVLPLLERCVDWQDVADAVFSKTCRHCHSDAAFAFGEGGPGNTGGFGFEARGLELATYQGALSGVLVDGQRESIFRQDSSGESLLVRVLRGRQLEEVGRGDVAVRGMPLGHEAVTAEELQLVRTWVAQGHVRECE